MPRNVSLNCDCPVTFNLPSELVELIAEICYSDLDIFTRSQFLRGCVIRRLLDLPDYADRALIILNKAKNEQ